MKKSIFLILMAVSFFSLASFTFLRSPEQSTRTDFEEFINHFPKAQLPYSVGQEELYASFQSKWSESPDEQRIERRFKDFIPNLGVRFSRMGPSMFKYEALLAKTTTRVILIYSKYDPFSAYPSYWLATYSPKGKLQSNEIIAQRLYETITEASIDKTFNIVIKEFSVNKEGNSDNYEEFIPQKELKFENKRTFSIEKDGKLKEMDVAAVDRDAERI